MKKKINKEFQLTITSQRGVPGINPSTFNGIIIKESTGEIQTIDSNSFSEVIKEVPGNTSTLNGDVAIGSKLVVVQDGSQFQDGDIIKIGSFYYYIKSILNNTITTLEPSKGHTSGETVEQVGNTGIYTVPVTLNELGNYKILISNPLINMQNYPTNIEIVEYENSDIIETVNNQIIKNKQKSYI